MISKEYNPHYNFRLEKEAYNILVELSTKVNSSFNQLSFFYTKTPLQFNYFIKTLLSDDFDITTTSHIPFYLETVSVLFVDLFYNTSNFLTKSDTCLNDLRYNADSKRNEFSKIIDDYNAYISIVNKVNKTYSKFDKKRASLQRHYINNVFSNDFYQATTSIYFKYICSLINFKQLYTFSIKQLYYSNNENLDSNILEYSDIKQIEAMKNLKVLEFLKMYDIDVSYIDEFINKPFSVLDDSYINAQILHI